MQIKKVIRKQVQGSKSNIFYLSCGYRAAYCPEVSLSDKEYISELRRTFEKYNIVIAEAGAWCNLISVNNSERKKNFKYVCERLALADEIGAHCCVDSFR